MLKPEELRLGEWYWIAGQGPLRLLETPHGRSVAYVMEALGGQVYWAGADQFVYQMEEPGIRNYVAELKLRNISVAEDWETRLPKKGSPS